MGLGPLDDIPFDVAGATQLAAEFDQTADTLEAQSSSRPGLADGARSPWDGQLRGRFDDRVTTCVADGQRLAAAMRDAAQGVRELADRVEEENRRRAWARDYHAQQQDKAWYERVGGNVVDFFTGRDPVPAPPPAPNPPTTEILTEVAFDRG